MHALYHQARFLTSAANVSQAPADKGIEVAFAGRSNAGKSSAINVLCQQKALARTSRTPGRTQLLNFFSLDPERRIVDLPGYGYAKVAEPVKRQWQQALAAYLEQRRCLRGVVLLVDIRHLLKEYDRQMLAWSREIGLPVHILLTKSDKLKRGAANRALQQARGNIAEYGPGCSIQTFSALKHEGIDQAHAVLDHWFGLTTQPQTPAPVGAD